MPRVTLTPEQANDLKKVVGYAIATQFGERVPARVGAVKSVIQMHIEDLLNEVANED